MCGSGGEGKTTLHRALTCHYFVGVGRANTVQSWRGGSDGGDLIVWVILFDVTGGPLDQGVAIDGHNEKVTMGYGGARSCEHGHMGV